MFLPHFLTIMITFAEFSAKPFVQRACRDSNTPAAVLTFFYGSNFLDGQEREEMEDGTLLNTTAGI